MKHILLLGAAGTAGSMNTDGAGILPRRCTEGDAGHRQFFRKDVSAETVVAEKQSDSRGRSGGVIFALPSCIRLWTY